MKTFLLSSAFWLLAAAVSAQTSFLGAGQGVPSVESLKIQISPSQVSGSGLQLPIELRTPDMLATSLAAPAPALSLIPEAAPALETPVAAIAPAEVSPAADPQVAEGESA